MRNNLALKNLGFIRIFKLVVVVGIIFCSSFKSNSQTVATFENLTLSIDTYWNGSDLSGGFTSGAAFFTNRYDTAYGGSWSGFAYSSKIDDTTSGYANQYSAITGEGYNSSSNYGIFYYSTYSPTSRIKITTDTVMGFYITNSTWAALSMLNGDAFSKKFGGTTGNDSDWFKITISGYYNGSLLSNTVDFYLADYRFTDNFQDYIITNWTWVDLTSLGLVDSLEFTLSSTDVGTFGMNTPAFFCLDNFTTKTNPAGIANRYLKHDNISIYPTLAQDYINIDIKNNDINKYKIEISDINGKVIYLNDNCNSSTIQVNVSDFSNGLYFIKLMSGNNYILSENNKFLIQH